MTHGCSDTQTTGTLVSHSMVHHTACRNTLSPRHTARSDSHLRIATHRNTPHPHSGVRDSHGVCVAARYALPRSHGFIDIDADTQSHAGTHAHPDPTDTLGCTNPHGDLYTHGYP